MPAKNYPIIHESNFYNSERRNFAGHLEALNYNEMRDSNNSQMNEFNGNSGHLIESVLSQNLVDEKIRSEIPTGVLVEIIPGE